MGHRFGVVAMAQPAVLGDLRLPVALGAGCGHDAVESAHGRGRREAELAVVIHGRVQRMAFDAGSQSEMGAMCKTGLGFGGSRRIGPRGGLCRSLQDVAFRASAWLRLHVAGGFLAIALFWLHARSLWPTGAHRQALAGAFYLLSASGIVGWLLQRTYPRQLADTGLEIIYEHIPAEIARLRNAADQLVLDTTRDAGNDTLARHYMETLHWFFRRPRFFVNHAFFGGKHARAWVRQQCGVVRPYLGAVDRERLERLAALAEEKLQIDFHHAAQSIMKRWLLVHLPLAAVTTILVVWHVLLVHAYGR